MILSTCTPYFRDLIAQSDTKKKKILFTTACHILGPKLRDRDARFFCNELGVPMDFAPLYDQCMADVAQRH